MPPKAVASMRFVTIKSIIDYISTDNLLTCWGGTDNYEFDFEPEQQPTDVNGRHETDTEKLKRVRRKIVWRMQSAVRDVTNGYIDVVFF